MSVIFYLISRAFSFYELAIIIYILMSWFPGAYQSKIGQLLGQIVEPYLERFRRLPLRVGGIDLSPIVALFVLRLAQQGLFIVLRSIF
ncbi:MAG: YggT family protein [Streptococcaceae bacterium]|nr:YggT family protein [Streptococcaceae bacterium]